MFKSSDQIFRSNRPINLLVRRCLATTVNNLSPILSDITIVGGGPAGLTLAASLKSSRITSNLKINVIESSNLQPVNDFYLDPPVNYTNRVSSLTPQSIDNLIEIDAWKFINNDRICSYDNINVIDGISDERLDFERSEIATMCENINLQSALYQRIQELNNDINNDNLLNIIDNTKVLNIYKDQENEWPIVQLSNGSLLKTRLLIGADGSNSPVRKFAQIQSRGWSYNKNGLVATLKLKYEDFRSIAWQRFLTTGPIALLPLPENNATMVWSVDPSISDIILKKLSKDSLISLFNSLFILSQVDLNYLYKFINSNEYNENELIEEINWRIDVHKNKIGIEKFNDSYPVEIIDIIDNSVNKFPLKLSHSDSYVSNRIALVGDACHTIHSLSGQGLNMGQADVKSLFNFIETGCKRGLDIGNLLVLEPYYSDRYPLNHLTLGITDKLHKIYSIDFLPVVKLRSFGLNIVNNLDSVKDFMINQVSGPSK
ncbi:putative N,N-dimethylaniline monooxygenase COQ6 [Ascoidea rubescens DSM 1968]|uniref:Ubiquinone biosynthesis monooxygenase COQ6, mitochondrial n=1 Tax=Ascoidea rubescens DSM 1968 TaxID=1344418 RepID=A0A1D2V998_9ASCO|nr:ubiquinone biosynthesis hydrox [Ascoidea rubescens DSM 1968]ODV58232.1 ubiquinone biosynthesis hydrox [Ascoidea rubescens DSM 1968]